MSRVLALLLSTLVWSVDASASRWITGGHAAPRIGIFLDFEHNPSTSSILTMQREVITVLGATGFEFSWLSRKQDTAPETFDELAVLRFRGSCRMEKLGLPTLNENPVTLGQTDLASGAVSAYSSVECDEIKTCISGLLGNSCARDRETAFGRALGRVVAHELYHILGKTTKHTRHGISKGRQSSADLVKDHFQFDRQALLWLRQRLQIKNNRARESSPERGVPTV